MTLTLKLLIAAVQFFRFVTAQNEPGPAPPNSFSFRPKFNPSMAIIMIVLVTAFFLLGFFSVYIRKCAVTRFGGAGGFDPSPVGDDDGRGLRAARGLDATALETFPTFVYSSVKRLKIGKDVLECAVCLNEFEEDETLRLIPMCNHVFHIDCIDSWLCSHSTCPVCRADLTISPNEISGSTIIITDDQELEINQREPNEVHAVNLVQSPETSLFASNKSHTRRTRSTGFRFTGLFPRSHTTGHSMLQVGEYDRFTLILPEEVRNHMLNAAVLNRTRSCVEFPRARSTKRGFRSKSSGSKNNFFYERFNHEHRPGRLGSVERLETQKSLSRSVKSHFDRLFLGTDKEQNNVGERSSDRLRPDGEV